MGRRKWGGAGNKTHISSIQLWRQSNDIRVNFANQLVQEEGDMYGDYSIIF